MKKIDLFWLLVIILLFVRILNYYAQHDISSDHLLQMAVAQNFMEGNSFSFKYLNSNNEIYFITNIQSPPLYSFLLAIITFLTQNTLLSSFIIQIAILLSISFVWKKIFDLLKLYISEKAYYYFISLIIISASILNNINTILVLALFILSLSIYFNFLYMFSDKSKRFNLFVSAFFASLLFWTHYSYFLVAFFPSIVISIIFFYNKDKKYIYDAIKSFAISLIIASAVLLYNYLTTGSINYMDNPGIWDSGFYPEHLLLTDPFFLNAFFKTAYLLDYLFTVNQHVLVTFVFHLLSFIILITIVILLLKLKKKNNILFEKTILLIIPFIVIILQVISFLLYFTLHYYEIPRPGWTHIGDSRYLSAVYLSVIAIVTILVFNKGEYISSRVVNAIKLILMCLIIVNLSINIFITFKEWGNFTFQSESYKAPTSELQALYENIKREISRDNIPVFIDNDLTVRSLRISQYAGAAVINSSEVKNIYNIPSNIVFFFILPVIDQYRDEDYMLLDWGKRFKINSIGSVYTNLSLYKVSNQ